ncbi:hypothetical protein, partial [Planomonospora algeriensis]
GGSRRRGGPHGPAGTADVVPEDVWTGVMARPGGAPTVVTAPKGGPFIKEEIARKDFATAGVREEFTVPTGGERVMVTLSCYGPLTKAAIWIDGRLTAAGPCGGGSGTIQAPAYVVQWTAPQDFTAAGHTVSGAVLQTAGGEPEELTGTEDVEELLAAGGRSSRQWWIAVHRMGDPECRNDVRQVDPDTGEVVVLRCGDGTRTPGTP